MDPSSPDTSALRNLGFFVHRPEDHALSEHRTYVVLGLPRGGTTMMAKALEAMGIFIGLDADNAVGEDIALAEAFERGSKQAVAKIIASYDEANDVWGFKRPNIVAHLAGDGSEFRNPHYIVVLRDLLAIANRNRVSTFKDPFKDLRESMQATSRLLDYVERNSAAPMLFCSYDRVLADPRPFIEALAEFVGVELTTRKMRTVLHAVTPSDEYLDNARSDTFMGRVTGAEATSVHGFFRYHNQSEVQPPLELLVNDEPILDVEVEWFRTTIDRKTGRSFTGEHGFVIRLLGERRLQRGDRVIVIAADRRRQRLRNCPYRVKL